MASLTREGSVLVLDLGDGENRFNPPWLAEVGALLDEVEAAPSPRALVTSATGKLWSNGLDLDWLRTAGEDGGPFLADVHGLLARVLALPLPTVAALQGHCFAAGAMLALAHDQRVMRVDRGFLCLPEVDIRIPFTPGMAALIQARTSQETAHEAMTTGRRYGGADALAAGLVDATAGGGEVLAAAVERAGALAAKDGTTLAAIRERMYAEPLRLLRDRGTAPLVVPA